MRKITACLLALMLAANLAGCSSAGQQDPYRTDTVIYIPAEPTEAVTQPATETTQWEGSETTEESTEEAVPETTAATSSKKSSSSSSSSSKKNTSSSSSSSQKKPASTTKPTTAPTTAPTEAPTTEATTVPTEEPTTESTTEATEVPVETEPPLYDISGYTVGSLETAMMDEINSCRAAEGLEELNKSARLCAIASARAYEASQSWSHTRPNGSGYASVFRDYGFGCSASAENLIYTSGGEDGATLVSRWMDSDANRNNLMDAGFSMMGIGIYKANGYVYIACLLAG